MNHAALLLSLALVDLLAAMSPGPNFVLVTQSAIHRGTRFALAVVAGFVVSNLVWSTGVVLGLSSLFAAAPWLYRVMKVVGGVYLVFLGVQLWRSAGREPRLRADDVTRSAVGFARGFFTNMSNPKSVVYFGSVFAVFIAPGTPLWVTAGAVGIVLVNTLIWYGAVAVLFSAARVQQSYQRFRRTIDRVAGTVMGAFGARLVFARD